MNIQNILGFDIIELLISASRATHKHVILKNEIVRNPSVTLLITLQSTLKLMKSYFKVKPMG